MREYFQRTQAELFGTGSDPSDSIPLKPVPWPVRTLDPLKSPARGISERIATALVIATKALGARTVSGGMTVPRRFRVSGTHWIIENGCGQDIVRCGAAGLIPATDPQNDSFVLSNILCEWLQAPLVADRLSAFMRAQAPHLLNTEI
jgi:hypothetical protein